MGAARKCRHRGKASHVQDGGIMSSSSDIEKLFDHFGGDASAYQEIGRENDARTARTRWPLLVTLDLTQPTIPEIGQRREARPQPPFAPALAVDRQDTTPKDVASVTRAKAPLFTRSHRRDIPPVVVAAPQPAAPSGASRFGAPGSDDESALQAAPAAAAAMNDPVAVQPVPAASPSAPFTPLTNTAASAQAAPNAFAAPAAASASAGLFAASAAVPPAASISPVTPFAGAPFSSPFRTPAMPVPPAPAAHTPYAAPSAPASSAVPGWAQAQAQAPAPAQPYATAPAGPATAPAAAPASPAMFPQRAQRAPATQPASILGKLFAAPPAAASQPAAPAAASSDQPAPLQAVFDRLRGTPAQTHAPAATASATASASASHATPGVSPSWLVNGPRRS